MEISLSRGNPLYAQVKAYLNSTEEDAGEKRKILLDMVEDSDLETTLELLAEPTLGNLGFLKDLRERALNNKVDSWKQFGNAYLLSKKYGRVAEEFVAQHIIKSCDTMADYVAARSVFREYSNEFMLEILESKLEDYVANSKWVN